MEPIERESAAGSEPPRAGQRPAPAGTEPPRMPEIPGSDIGEDGLQPLRLFHLTGVRPQQAPGEGPAWPAALNPLVRPERAWREFPLLLAGEGAQRIEPLSSALERVVAELNGGGQAVRIVGVHAARLVRAFDRALAGRNEPVPLGTVFETALDGFLAEFDMSEAGLEAAREELRQVCGRLPAEASLLSLGSHTLPALYAELVGRDRERRLEHFREEARSLVRGLDDLLRLDDAQGGTATAPPRLRASLGEAAGLFVDPDSLARLLPEQRGSIRMTKERRRRVTGIRDSLRDWVADEARGRRRCVLIQAGPADAGEPPEGVERVEADDTLGVAAQRFDAEAERMLEIFRAARIARLEVRGGYSPELHDPLVRSLDWRSFTESELLLLPRIVVLESAERLLGRSLGALSALLQSRRPIQLLVPEAPLEAPPAGADPLARFRTDPGSLAVAHREALVVQTSVGRAAHLVDCLAQLAVGLRAGMALVAVPSGDAVVPAWLELDAATTARVWPYFRYEPAAGESWAERFDVGENPDTARPWPVLEVAFRDVQGAEQSLVEPFTLAHFAALDPACRGHFQRVGPEAWADEMVEVAEYLDLDEQQRRERLPFIWTVDEEGVLGRALVTSELAEACRERRRAWRVLQELGGVENEHARRAAAAARREAESEAGREREELIARHAEELEQVRSRTAAEAIERLVAALTDLDLDAAPRGAAAPAVEQPPPEEPAPEAEAEPQAQPVPQAEEEAELALDEPYIDSALCTSCNDCINLNRQMFKYNENKQAFIADATAGSYVQLVAAAEKCPARCIHPGKPRPDDDTATDDLIRRAAAFG